MISQFNQHQYGPLKMDKDSGKTLLSSLEQNLIDKLGLTKIGRTREMLLPKIQLDIKLSEMLKQQTILQLRI